MTRSRLMIPVIIGVLAIAFILVDIWLRSTVDLHGQFVEIINGPHQGRRGKVTSTCWIGNLYHTWVSVNVPATEQEIRDKYSEKWGERVEELIDQMKGGYGPRQGVTVPRRSIRAIPDQQTELIVSADHQSLLQAIRLVERLTAIDMKHTTIFGLLTAPTKELGELAEAIGVEEKAFGSGHKTVDEPSTVEAIDLAICAFAVYFARGGKEDQIAKIMTRKLRKWELQQGAENVQSIGAEERVTT